MSEESKSLDAKSLESQCCKSKSNLLILFFIIDSFGVLDLRGLDTSLQATLFAQYDGIFMICLDCFGESTIRLAMTNPLNFLNRSQF